MKLTKNQFIIMHELTKQSFATLGELVAVTQLTLPIVRENWQSLIKRNYLNKFSLTTAGQAALDFYKVDNAVIMAAGISSRFAPLSYERPKGLFKVKGEVLIERQIRQLREAGITEIILVVGYMKEQFFYLEDKYQVKIVVNEDYYRYNNISTLYLVKNDLKNTYICSSDNYFSHNVFSAYVYEAYYAAVWQSGQTAEYCITEDLAHKIIKVTIGGHDAWVMLGQAYFSREFSEKFTRLLTKEYANDSIRTLLWENLYMQNLTELAMVVEKYAVSEIYEIDSIDDLKKLDLEFLENIDSVIIDNICKVINCQPGEISRFQPLKKGMTNFSFCFEVDEVKYVYRHPGIGTEKIINRRSECFAQQAALKLGIDPTLLYMDENDGWKIARYMEGEIEFDYHNEQNVKQILKLIKKLHEAAIQSPWEFNFWAESEKYLALTKQAGRKIFNSFNDLALLRNQIKYLYQQVEADQVPKRLCHIDCFATNFLTNGQTMCLIDWEYAGNADPASDLGTLLCSSDYDENEILQILAMYFARDLTPAETRHYLAYIAITGYCWFTWALYKESMGNVTGEYLYIWYKYAKKYSKIALELYE